MSPPAGLGGYGDHAGLIIKTQRHKERKGFLDTKTTSDLKVATKPCGREIFVTFVKAALPLCEWMLRLIYIHRTKTKYLPLDFVTMRTGGASTSGMASHKRIMYDHLRAFKKNKIYSNVVFESLRYIYKVCEIMKHKMKGLY